MTMILLLWNQQSSRLNGDGSEVIVRAVGKGSSSITLGISGGGRGGNTISNSCRHQTMSAKQRKCNRDRDASQIRSALSSSLLFTSDTNGQGTHAAIGQIKDEGRRAEK